MYAIITSNLLPLKSEISYKERHSWKETSSAREELHI